MIEQDKPIAKTIVEETTSEVSIFS